MESNLQGVIKIKDDFVSFYDVDLSVYKKWVEESCVKLLLLIFILLITGCASASPKQGEFREWQEEVKLNDGRVIVVKQKWRCERIGKYDNGKEYCATMRESWLTFNLPEFSNHDIEWNEQLHPLVLNIDNAQLYIVGVVDGMQFLIRGRPQPPYVGYRWEVDGWHQIPFNEIPEAIYIVNMATEFPLSDSPLLFKLNAKLESNRDPSLPKPYKRIDPNLRLDSDLRFSH